MSDVVIDWLYYSRASNGYCSLDIFQPNVWPFWAYITYTMRYITDQKSLMQILDLISCSDIPVLPVTFHWWCFSKKQCIQCREESIPIQIVADDFRIWNLTAWYIYLCFHSSYFSTVLVYVLLCISCTTTIDCSFTS